MATNKVMQEIYIEEDTKKFFIDFSPIGKYSFLFKAFIFRGERSEIFGKLLPTSLREDQKSINRIYGLSDVYGINSAHLNHNLEINQQFSEFVILNKFYQTANYKGINLPDVPFLRDYESNFPFFMDITTKSKNTWLTNELLELAALAQHYGLPTRLIDWSKDIYTSLYFASSGALHTIDDESKFMILYALNLLQINSLKTSAKRIPIRIIIPEHYKNPNLNFQRGILSAWEYKSGYSINPDKGSLQVNRQSLDVLMQEYVDKNNISWEVPITTTQEPIIYKFYIPIKMSLRIYEYIKMLGYGADKLFNGYEGVLKMMEDDMVYRYSKYKTLDN